MNTPSAGQSNRRISGSENAAPNALNPDTATGDSTGDSTGGGYSRRPTPAGTQPSYQQRGPTQQPPLQQELPDSFHSHTSQYDTGHYDTGHAGDPFARDPLHRDPLDAGRGPSYHAGVRKCPECKTYAYVTADACPECGEELQLRPKVIRCRRCGKHANSELVICPHCARDLEPTPSMAWTLAAPALLVFVLGLATVGYWGDFARAGAAFNGAALTAAGNPDMGEEGEPLRVITPIPADEAVLAENDTVENDTAENDAIAEDATGAAEAVALEQPAGQPAEEDASVASVPEADLDAAAADAGAAAVVEDVLPEPTAEIAAADVGETGEGDEVVAVDPAAVNSDSVARGEPESRGIGGLIRRPVTVSENDSNNVSNDSANDSEGSTGSGSESGSESGNDADEALVVRAASAVQSTNEPPENSAATGNSTEDVVDYGVQDSNSPESEGNNASDYRLTAPVLRGPEDGSVLSCDESEKLTWLPVPYMEADESYLLHLGFVTGRTDDGSEQVIWVLAQPRPANFTSWELDSALCNLAPAEHGHQWRWWVEAAQGESGALESISPPSEVWGFRWD